MNEQRRTRRLGEDAARRDALDDLRHESKAAASRLFRRTVSLSDLHCQRFP